MKAYRIIIVANALALIGACASNPATGGRDLVFMSEDAEIALGRQYHPQVLAAYGRYDDDELQEYVRGVGERIAETSHRGDLYYRFHVVDTKDINAFALPGGYIYITRGLLAYLNSEAELAAVLAHEIGHVTARHAVRQQSAATLAGVAGTAVAIGTGSTAALDIANLFGAALVSGYGRKLELEADELGAEYLARSGYDPQAMIGVIGLLKNQEEFEIEQARKEKREPRIYHGVFATHPDQDTRLQEVVSAATALVSDDDVHVGRDEYLTRIDGLVYGSQEREGILRGSRFYHAPLGLFVEFPEHWRVENHPRQLLAYSSRSDALMRMSADDLNRKITPAEFMRTRMNLKNLTNEESFEVNGFPAHTAIQQRGSTPFGTRSIRYIVIFYREQAYVFAGTTEDIPMPARYDEGFLATARRFRPLREDELELAQPMVLRLVRADGRMDFEDLALRSPITNYPKQVLRLLNDQYPDGEPPTGHLIKYVE